MIDEHYILHFLFTEAYKDCWGHHGRDCIVVGFKTTIAASAHHCWSCEFESCSLRGVLDTTLCDKSL